ncbi:MAG: hypothetical protein LUC88_04080 [Prevotella sp.]|nr:hypothetical protein [Prevotella sp.]
MISGVGVKRVRGYYQKRSWQTSRYIQVSAVIKDWDIHYELINGRIQLHFEGKYEGEEYLPLIRYLKESVRHDGRIQWRWRYSKTKGQCELNQKIEEWEDLTSGLNDIVSIFDPLLDGKRIEKPQQGINIIKCRTRLHNKVQAHSVLDTHP